jgi:hypothetical protein
MLVDLHLFPAIAAEAMSCKIAVAATTNNAG